MTLHLNVNSQSLFFPSVYELWSNSFRYNFLNEVCLPWTFAALVLIKLLQSTAWNTVCKNSNIYIAIIKIPYKMFTRCTQDVKPCFERIWVVTKRKCVEYSSNFSVLKSLLWTVFKVASKFIGLRFSTFPACKVKIVAQCILKEQVNYFQCW